MAKRTPEKNVRELQKLVIAFRDKRNWKQFNNPKDVALSMVLEAGEVMEHFQWKNPEEITEYIKTNKVNIGEELADVLYWVLLMGHDLNINLSDAVKDKLKKNELKYPVKKAKNNHSKYNKI